MKVPVRWLREFVATDLPSEEIARRLTMAGLEAESIERIGEGWDKVYVGLVEKVERHPNADRLVLATVVAGEHRLTVVTGAPNIAAGQNVALALVGARLIDGHSEEIREKTLKVGDIRGVRSEGMVCSEKELGISDEHEGIMVLPEDAPAGLPLRDYLGDDVIEFEITPNLVHDFSVQGIARELGALLDLPVKPLATADLSALPREDERVEIADADLCGRFTMTLIENVTIAPSPAWLAQRLQHAGVRPINNVVDISNYVMLEMGHPTHPFDADKLVSDHIVVRRARPGEPIETIDHVERELSGDMLVIADREKANGIAGIMGGVGTEVEDTTTRVLLESAWFDPKGVRRTSRELKLVTDASARFQRDIDPNGASIGAARFVELLKEIDPGARPVHFADVFLRPRERRSLTFKFSEIERLLGMVIPLDESLAILRRLEFEPVAEESAQGTLITVSIPTYRNDVSLPADLVEEVARINGYENLPETLAYGRTAPVFRDPARLVDDVAQDALVEAGLFQVQTYTMIADDDLVALSARGDAIPYVLGGYPKPETDYVRAVNPLRADWALMRPTLLPSVLKIAAENLKYSERVAIFETARTYQPRGLDELPDERRAVVIVMAGKREPFGVYHTESAEFDFFDVKGAVETLLGRLGARDVTFTPVEHPSLHPQRAAAVERGGVQIGTLGELHPRVAARFGIDTRTAVAELDLEPFHTTLLENWSSSPVSRFQPIRQDFAIVVDEATPAAAVAEAIQGGAGPLATEITVFDVYRGTTIGDGKKSLAFRVTLSAPDRQLSERELDRLRERIEQTVQRRVGGVLRS